MQKFVIALNSVGPQPIAMFLIAIGVCVQVLYKSQGIDSSAGHDMLIAGIAMLNGQALSSKSQSTDGAHGVTLTTQETPAAQAATFPSPSNPQPK